LSSKPLRRAVPGKGFRILIVAAALAVTLCGGRPLAANPSLRPWLLSGGEKLEAELIDMKPGNVVVLGLPGGGVKEVPLASLSKVDQSYVQRNLHKPAAAAEKPADKSGDSGADAADHDSQPRAVKNDDPATQLRVLKGQAQRAATPEVAAMLFELFLNENKLPSDVRAEAEAERAEWQDRAKRGLVRFGAKWLSLSEVRAERKKAFFLTANALELIRLNQGKIAIEKLQEASRTNPESIQADFIMGIGYAQAKQFDNAYQHYKICLKRDPANIAVLNNLALVEIKRANFSEAVTAWKAACHERYDERMVQNMGRMLDQAGKQKLPVNKETLNRLNRLYSDMVVTNRVAGATSMQGWLYMLIPAEVPPDETVVAASTVDDAGDPVISATASGFVVSQGFVLTHLDLAKNARKFQVVDPSKPDGAPLTAKLVAKSEIADMALLQCEGLNCPPLPIAVVPPAVETPITVVGYLPAAGQSTPPELVRGLVVANPYRSLELQVVYKVGGAFSSVGGPVCDNAGSVVAMHEKNLSILANSYGGGAPMFWAAPMLQASIPSFRPAQRSSSISRDEVESRLKASTVIVVAVAPTQDLGQDKRIGANYREDCSCCRCRGLGILECPVRACKKGGVPVSVTEVVARDPTTGLPINSTRNVYVPCDVCKGQGKIPCSACGGRGIDPELAGRPAALALVSSKAAKQGFLEAFGGQEERPVLPGSSPGRATATKAMPIPGNSITGRKKP